MALDPEDAKLKILQQELKAAVRSKKRHQGQKVTSLEVRFIQTDRQLRVDIRLPGNAGAHAKSLVEVSVGPWHLALGGVFAGESGRTVLLPLPVAVISNVPSHDAAQLRRSRGIL